MTTKQTIIAILTATVFQFIAEATWFLGFAKPIMRTELGCIMRADPYVPLNFVSELALSMLVVLAVRFYSKPINFKGGLLVGLLVGALVSLNQQIDWFANWILSPFLFIVETAKNTMLGAGIGVISAFAGRKRQADQQQAASYSVV